MSLRTHNVTLDSRPEVLYGVSVDGWFWVCSCGKRARYSWYSKYAARHAGENHVIRMKGK